MSDLTSPCIRVCALDPVRRICTGCGRTMDEISQWIRLDEDQRNQVRKQLASRLKCLKESN